jgi:molybdenum cofactor cytidylyltransferase
MTGLLILAAGQSSRLGRPKQMLAYMGESLVKRAVKNGLNSVCTPVIVVLGANFDLILAEIAAENLDVLNNTEWNEGIASSIRLGVRHAQKNKHITSLIIMLCDQPFADVILLNNLVEQYSTVGKSIVACTYADTVGVPALFSSKYFPELSQLKGNEGARKLISTHSADVSALPFPLGDIDIDTDEDYNNLVSV